MVRMHSTGKGIARSSLPYVREAPEWFNDDPEDVIEEIARLAKKGFTPSQIGVTLRDSQGIPQVKYITGSKILRILKVLGSIVPREV